MSSYRGSSTPNLSSMKIGLQLHIDIQVATFKFTFLLYPKSNPIEEGWVYSIKIALSVRLNYPSFARPWTTGPAEVLDGYVRRTRSECCIQHEYIQFLLNFVIYSEDHRYCTNIWMYQTWIFSFKRFRVWIMLDEQLLQQLEKKKEKHVVAPSFFFSFQFFICLI